MLIACVEDQRKLAQRRVPRMFYDYVDSGSWTESTYRANEEDLKTIHFRQRVGIDVSLRNTQMKMLGNYLPMPVALAPTGLAGMLRANGEILAAKAAEEFGVPFTLSTMSICSIEDVAENTNSPFWFQLYVMRDRDFIQRLIERARVARCSALMVTVDLQIMGQRHKDVHNGLSAPPKFTVRNALNLFQIPNFGLFSLVTFVFYPAKSGQSKGLFFVSLVFFTVTPICLILIKEINLERHTLRPRIANAPSFPFRVVFLELA